MKNVAARFEDFVAQLGIKFGPATEVVKAYNKGLQERLNLKDKFLGTWRPTLPLRPSSALACQRKLFYELENFYQPGRHTIKPTDIRQSRIYKAGDIFEEYELSQLESLHNIKITHRQHRLKITTIGGEQIQGSIDGLLWLTPEYPYLIDIKTITTYQYKDIERTFKPKMSNVAQLSLYACSEGFKELMGTLGVTSTPKCALLYINKDSLQYTIVQFDPNEKLAKGIIQRFKKIYEAGLKHEVPARDFVETDSFPCGRYCSFFELCQGGGSDPDKNIKLEKDPDVSQPEEDVILDLWQFGDSSTYESPSYKFEVTRLKTKWSLEVEQKEIPVEVKIKKKVRARNKTTK